MNTGFPGWLGWLESNQHEQSQSLHFCGLITSIVGLVRHLCVNCVSVLELRQSVPALLNIHVRIFLRGGYRGVPKYILDDPNTCTA